MHFSVLTAALLAVPVVHANLHQLAVAAGKLYFGSATDNNEIKDTAFAAILSDKNEFGQITPGNGQKWQFIEPSQNQFSYTSGDEITNFAKANGQILRCHTLVWHSQLPAWVSSGTWTPAQLTAIINNHIANEVAHYNGACYAWDVVNEAVDDNGSFRTSVFFNVLGRDFIPIAFKAAAIADPAAKLYYNDYNIESAGAKQKTVLSIIADIKAAGARIDGLGLQAHLIVGSTPSRAALAAVLTSFVDAGVAEVTYTELDIRHSSLPASTTALEQQAKDYVSVVGACLDIKACVGVTVWGFSDRFSWIPSVFPGQGDATLMDKNLVPKPAYSSVSSLLAAAATGPVVSPPAGTTLATSIRSTTSTVKTTLATSVKTSTAVTPTQTGAQAARWGQCGGIGWSGPTACVAPYTCKKSNDYYSQCL